MAKKHTWKKVLALLIALLVFCLPLASCQSGEKEDGTSSEASSKETSSKSEGSAGTETLRVVTDLANRMLLYGKKLNTTQAKQAFNSILNYFGGTFSGLKVELEILSSDNAGAYESELTHIRTEIAAGAGPDVFLMSCFGSSARDTLFLNPESAMERGIFLPLDSYIENAQFMEFDQFDQAVMEAGRSEQGQVILPMFYQLNQLFLYRDTDPAALPAGWDEAVAMAKEDEYIRDAYAQALSWSSNFRAACFGKISNNKDEELLISQEELFQRTKEAVELYQSDLPTLLEYEHAQYEDFLENVLAQVDAWDNNLALERGEYTSFTLRDEEGKVTVPIETWCAVNRNTQHPEDAFAIVDMLLSKEFLSQEIFWSKTQRAGGNHDSMAFFWTAGESCVPVHTGLLSDARGSYKYINGLTSNQRKALTNARENIGYVYFPNRAEREMDQMLADLLERIYNGETLSDEAIRKETDKCYTTMKLMLGES